MTVPMPMIPVKFQIHDCIVAPPIMRGGMSSMIILITQTLDQASELASGGCFPPYKKVRKEKKLHCLLGGLTIAIDLCMV